jgi:hypothetical protein
MRLRFSRLLLLILALGVAGCSGGSSEDSHLTMRTDPSLKPLFPVDLTATWSAEPVPGADVFLEITVRPERVFDRISLSWEGEGIAIPEDAGYEGPLRPGEQVVIRPRFRIPASGGCRLTLVPVLQNIGEDGVAGQVSMPFTMLEIEGPASRKAEPPSGTDGVNADGEPIKSFQVEGGK